MAVGVLLRPVPTSPFSAALSIGFILDGEEAYMPMGDTQTSNNEDSIIVMEVSTSSFTDEPATHKVGTEYVPHFVSNNMDALAID